MLRDKRVAATALWRPHVRPEGCREARHNAPHLVLTGTIQGISSENGRNLRRRTAISPCRNSRAEREKGDCRPHGSIIFVRLGVVEHEQGDRIAALLAPSLDDERC